MTALPIPTNPDRFRFLATFIAGRSVDVTEAPAGEPAHTDGQFIFVSAGGSVEEQRREMLVQAALLGAGSLDPRLVKGLRARSDVGAPLPGTRRSAGCSPNSPRQIPLAAALLADGQPSTSTADESLEVAKSRAKVADPPEWFGVIKPSRLLVGARRTGRTGHRQRSPIAVRPDRHARIGGRRRDDDDGGKTGESKILKLFESPLFNNQSMSDFFRKLFGGSRSPGDGAAGAEMTVRSTRRVQRVGPNARPLPTRIRFTDDGTPGAAVGVGGALYPEWDVLQRPVQA